MSAVALQFTRPTSYESALEAASNLAARFSLPASPSYGGAENNAGINITVDKPLDPFTTNDIEFFMVENGHPALVVQEDNSDEHTRECE